MKRSFSLLLICLSFSMLFSSCKAVYVDIEKPPASGTVEVDLESEYFTNGTLLTQTKAYMEDGYVYDGALYFVLRQPYYTGSVTYAEDGHKVTSKEGKICKRIVRMNAETGIISSPCLDPVCTHGPGSNCPLMEKEGLNMSFQMIYDDWIVIQHYTKKDPVYGTLRQLHAYNIKTGQTVELFADSFEDNTYTNFQTAISVFDGNFYIVKHELDYSGTKFKPNGSKPLSDYEPETKSYLYEYNIEKNKMTELFEIPDGAHVRRITNKRFLIRTEDGEYYFCNLDGSNLQKSDVLDFFPMRAIGTLSFTYTETGYKVYDLKTNQTTYVEIDDLDYDPVKELTITANNSYIHVYDWTTEEEYKAVSAERRTFMDEHFEMDPEELNELVDEVFGLRVRKANYGGKAQIWKCNHYGNDLELVLEIEYATTRFIGITDKYAYIVLSKADPDNEFRLFPEFKSQPSYLNLETGEITPIPELELILPENAWHTKEEMLENLK